MNDIRVKQFCEINLEDPFFNTLKNDYKGFEEWFYKKTDQGETAYILEDEGIQGFLYLKEEDEGHQDIDPNLRKYKRLKVGTFKINAHGTKLGERFIKIILDSMMMNEIKEAYVTIFDKHDSLISLLKEFGFTYHGIKKTENGEEDVYIKNVSITNNKINFDYPKINTKSNKKLLLAILPKYHTEMFPDSKLKTEKNHVIRDLSHTNSIKKVYLSAAYNISNYDTGDLVVIYRTKDNHYAKYSSVATSVCTIESIKHIKEFKTFDEFYDYCGKKSIFSETELKRFWNQKKYPYIITMLYNIALSKRIIRNKLISDIGLDSSARWTALPLTDNQFERILKDGEVNENFIID